MRKQLSLFFGKSIPLNEDVSIKQPTVNEIVEMGEDVFGKLTLPYTINLDLILDDTINKADLSIFDLFFEHIEGEGYVLDNVLGGDSIEMLVESLSFFTDVDKDNIQVLPKRRKIIISGSYMVDKLSFEEVRKAVQAVTVRKDIEVEKPPQKMTDRQKDIWEKLQVGRRRQALREAIKLEDMANFISFGGNSYVPIESLLKMTYYQFHNAYSAVLSIDSYNIGMSYKLSQKYDVKDEVKHWTKSLKINTDLD